MQRPALPVTYWLLFLLILLTVPPVLAGQFGGDSGIFAYIGQVILKGGVPYRDAWDIKGPLVYLVYAAGLWLTPHQAFGTLLIDVLLLAGALISLCSLSYRLGQSRAFGYGACVVLICSGPLEVLRIGQPDSWAGYICIILLALLYAPLTYRTALVSGAIIGALVLLKPPYILLGLLSGALILYEPKRWRLLTAHAMAGLAILLLGAAYLDASGAMPAFIETVQFYRDVHMQNIDGSDAFFVRTADPAYYAFLIYIAAGFVGSFSIYKSLNKRMGLMLFGLIAVNLAVLLLQGRFYTYQRAPLLLVSSLPMAWLILQLKRGKVPAQHGRMVMIVTTAIQMLSLNVLILTAFISAAASYRLDFAHWQNCPGATKSTACLKDYEIQGIVGRWETAAFIKTHTLPEAPIYQFGFDAGLYLESERPAASRFIYNYPLVVNNTAWQQRYRAALMAELAAVKPAAIVVQRMDAGPVIDPKPREQFERDGFRSSDKMLETFPELEAYIAHNYTLAHQTEHSLIYLPQ